MSEGRRPERKLDRVVEVTERLGRGLEAVAERLEKIDVPRLARNVMALSITAMGIYTSAVAVATMLPYATAVFQQVAVIFGFFIPLMIMFTLASVLMTFFRKALGR